MMVPTLQTVSQLRCESYELSKHSRASLPMSSRSRTNKLFELVHPHVWGPLAIPNYGPFKYYVLFVDDYSQMTWLYLRKERIEVFSKFQ